MANISEFSNAFNDFHFDFYFDFNFIFFCCSFMNSCKMYFYGHVKVLDQRFTDVALHTKVWHLFNWNFPQVEEALSRERESEIERESLAQRFPSSLCCGKRLRAFEN